MTRPQKNCGSSDYPFALQFSPTEQKQCLRFSEFELCSCVNSKHESTLKIITINISDKGTFASKLPSPFISCQAASRDLPGSGKALV